MENLVHGVDVSVYEPKVDWRVLRAGGFRFALIRATSSTGYVDPKFKMHWEGARREGILRGAYHYLFGGLEAKKQADLFISTVGSDKGELPPIVDLEDAYNDNVANSKIIETCKAFLDITEKAFGRTPMIYSRSQYLNTKVSKNGNAPSWANKYHLWLAQYPFKFDPDTMPNKNMPTQTAGWQDWKFWQYSESAIVEGVTNEIGIPTPCDLDWFRGTEAELYAFANVKQKEQVRYTIKKGDTLKSVAEEYKITVDELLNSNADLLKEGTKLNIPVPTISKPNTGSGSNVSLTTSTKTHTVVANQTLGAIATKYNTTISAIMEVNPQITNPNLVFVGQVIVLP